MKFSTALLALEHGEKVTRTGWNGKGMWLELQRPDEHSKMTLPYIYLNYPKGEKYPDGARVPWLASQTDLLADDWEVVLEDKEKPTEKEIDVTVEGFLDFLTVLSKALDDPSEEKCKDCKKKDTCKLYKEFSSKKKGKSK